jgi:drug/metabolite transporter (DMT)-like permease
MKKVIALILLAAFIFSTMEVALKGMGSSIDPFQMTALRFLLGGVLLLPAGLRELKKNKVKFDMKLVGWMVLLGVLCVPGGMILFQFGILHSNASTASVIFCTNPVFIATFAHFLNENDRFSKAKGVAIFVAAIGLIMMIRPWDIQEGNSVLGVILMLGAAAVFSLYSVVGARTLGKIGAYGQTSLAFISGSLILLIFNAIFGKPIVSGLVDNLPDFLYIGIVVTGVGYLFYFMAIKLSNATTGSITFFLKPVIAPCIAMIVLDEKILWNTLVGIALILVASYIILREKLKASKAL